MKRTQRGNATVNHNGDIQPVRKFKEDPVAVRLLGYVMVFTVLSLAWLAFIYSVIQSR